MPSESQVYCYYGVSTCPVDCAGWVSGLECLAIWTCVVARIAVLPTLGVICIGSVARRCSYCADRSQSLGEALPALYVLSWWIMKSL